MRPKHIFVGSAGESRALAERVAQELDAKGLVPRRWWKEFPAGSYTLDRLRELAQQVDGAVLLGVGVDFVTSRSIESAAPRDNVILEYGLFVGALGRDCCVLAIDSDSKLPSDVHSITNIAITRDESSVAEKVAKHFVDYFSSIRPRKAEGTAVIADPKIVELYLAESSNYPEEWHQRHLYYGSEGAANWLRLSQSSWYHGKEHNDWVRQAAIDLSHVASPQTFVSLGPGDARIDIAVIKKLIADDKSTVYIPVDISEPLLHRAISKVSEFANTPIGILGDFEEGLPFIYRQVCAYCKPPVLYSLLGSTLGNFDNSEDEDFLNSMKSIMAGEDRLLIQVSIAGEWSRDKDPRANTKSLDVAFKQFVSHGVSKRLGIPMDTCVKQFDKNIEVLSRSVPCSDKTTHQYLEYWWKHARGRYLCTRICRFSLSGLMTQLRSAGFKVNPEPIIWPDDPSAVVRYAMLMLEPLP